jgi:LDH2 family malate/lactate/ureidoglycolate dehydrogenase
MRQDRPDSSSELLGAQQGGVVADPARLLRLTTALFHSVGVPAHDASTIGEILLETDLRGVESHGVALLGLYIDCLTKGEINPQPIVRLIRDRPAVALIDGDRGMGHLVSYKAMQLCLEKARHTGIAAVGVRNSCHFGMAAYYAMMGLSYDMIGFATTNVAPIMTPYRGLDATVGNNPLAYAFPAAPNFPLVIDLAVSVVAAGKIGLAGRLGNSIPPGWAIDGLGSPLTDPASALEDLRLEPMGGAKGYCLGVAMEALAGILPGAQFGSALVAPGRIIDQEVGHFFWAIDTAAFTEPLQFRQRMTELIRQIQSTRARDPNIPVLVPGEPELRQHELRSNNGIPIGAQVWSELGILAERYQLTECLANVPSQ